MNKEEIDLIRNVSNNLVEKHGKKYKAFIERALKSLINRFGVENTLRFINNESTFTECVLHNHTVNSIFDAVQKIDELAVFLSMINVKSCVISDHGVMTGVDTFVNNMHSKGIKPIVGVESYFRDGDKGPLSHLILYGRNDDGRHALCKAVTESNRNLVKDFPVMNSEIIQKYFGKGSKGYGNVICTSACCTGILATIFNKNFYIKKEISKIEKRMKEDVDVKEFRKVEEKITSIDSKILSRQEESRNLKKISEKKYVARLKKATKNNDIEEIKKIEEEKEESKEAALKINVVKEEISSLKKEKKPIKVQYDKLKKKMETILEKQSKIDDLKLSLNEPEALKEEAQNRAIFFKNIFSDNFFIEIQFHGMEMEKEVFTQEIELAKELNIPLVAANDAHMILGDEKDLVARELVRTERFKILSERSKEDLELYIKSDDELKTFLEKAFDKEDVKEAISNIKNISDRCLDDFKDQNHSPKFFKAEENKNADEELRKMCYKNIPDLYPEGLDEEKKKRLEYELSVIIKMGYSDYFLIVQDFLDYAKYLGYVPKKYIEEAPLTLEGIKKYCKENDFTVGEGIGPGRGSAVGSIVSYLLHITDVEPIKFDLLFERFLNEARVSMPDIDSDFKTDIRDKVKKYCEIKYGEKATCGIITINAYAPKGAIRAAGRFYDIKEEEKTGKESKKYLHLADAICKGIPALEATSFEKAEKYLEKWTNNKDAQNLIFSAKTIEGIPYAYGQHAAGVVISDNNDVSDYIPLKWSSSKECWTTQCLKEEVEENEGLLKMDFLGLRNLDIITNCERLIQRNHGKKISVHDIPLDDKKVYEEIFQKGRTSSVFQFESEGMKNVILRFKPESIDDVTLAVAVYRPGPKQYIDRIISVKSGKTTPNYVLPEMESILGNTYGCPVYQEQIMQIFNKFGGFSLPEADNIRRYMSKKKVEKFLAYKKKFLAALVQRGANPERAEEFWIELEEFARYAFNKSHACAYAHVSYYTAWFKYHYPVEYMTAVSNYTDVNKMLEVINDSKNFGINFKLPSIDYISEEFDTKDNEIIYGFSGVKGVGNSFKDIPKTIYKDIKDVVLYSNLNSRAIEALTLGGAFDSIIKNRRTAVENLGELLNIKKTISAERKRKALLTTTLELFETYEGDIEKIKEIAKSEDIKISDLKKSTTTLTLKKEVEKANLNIELAIQNLRDYVMDEYPEYEDVLKKEKEVLGNYISGHPLDNYIKPKNCINISDALQKYEEEPKAKFRIYGVIENPKTLLTRKDNQEMSIFSITDKTKTITGIVFPKNFIKFKQYINEDEVYSFSGSITEKETEKDGEIEIEYSFIVEDIKNVNKNKNTKLVSFEGLDSFVLTEDNQIINKIKEYEEPDGYVLFIKDYDSLIKETTFKVNKNIINDEYLKNKNVVITEI